MCSLHPTSQDRTGFAAKQNAKMCRGLLQRRAVSSGEVTFFNNVILVLDVNCDDQCQERRCDLFGNVTLNVEMIVHKDSMIESVRASLFWNIISLLL